MANIQLWVDRVQADIEPVRKLEVKLDKVITTTEKRRLDEILTIAIQTRDTFTEERKRRIREKAVEDLKKSSGVEAQVMEIEMAKAKLLQELTKIVLMGFDQNGEPLQNRREYPYVSNDNGVTVYADAAAYEKGRKLSGKKMKYVDDAVKALDDELASVTKLKTKLWLCDTYGDALVIMRAVLGNTDGIL